MIQRIKCCLYILMAKRYAVFIADEGKNLGKRTHCEIYNSNEPFLSTMEDIIKNFKKIGESILEEGDK